MASRFSVSDTRPVGQEKQSPAPAPEPEPAVAPAPAPAPTPVMRTSFDAGQLKLLALVNEVQDINLDDLDIQGKQIDWPQICVVGGQAEGSKCFFFSLRAFHLANQKSVTVRKHTSQRHRVVKDVGQDELPARRCEADSLISETTL
eukprot:COSAG04_NODE_4357_length_2139_cov_2.075000_3_plen_146_part_00